jgi:hypothetical protein
MSVDWSSDISSAEARAMKSQNAVTSHQKLEKRQRRGLEARPASAAPGSIGKSSIFPLKDGVEAAEVSRIIITLREGRGEITCARWFPSQVWPHLTHFVPAPSHSASLLLLGGVLVCEC